MSAPKEAPTADYIEKSYEHLHTLWSTAHAKMAKVDAYYQGTFGVWLTADDPRPAYHPPTVRAKIDHAVDTQMSVEPTIHKFPAGEGEVHQERADACEQPLLGVLQDASMRAPTLPARQIYKNLISYGYAQSALLWDESEKEEEPKRQKGEDDEEWEARQAIYEDRLRGWNPIRWDVPHPSRCLMDPLNMEPEEAIVLDRMYARDVQELTERKSKYRGKVVQHYEAGDNPYELLETIEYWSKEWHAKKIKGGQLIFLERNPFDRQPYSHGYAGWGQEPTYQGLNTLLTSYMAVGMLDGLLETFQIEAQHKSATHNAILNASYARPGTAGDAQKVAADLAAPPGTTVMEGEKDSVWWLQYPPLANWVFEVQKTIEADIEAATYASDQAGMRQEGVTTVGQQMILRQASERKFYVPALQVQRLVKLGAQNVLRMVMRTGQEITVRGKTLRPQDIENSYDLDVEYKQQDPMVEMDLQKIDMQKVQMALMSPETFMENHGLEDTSEEEMRLLRAKVMALPVVQEFLAQKAMMKEGLAELVDQMKLAAQQPAQGQGQQPAVPPGVQAQPGAQPSPTPQPMPGLGNLVGGG